MTDQIQSSFLYAIFADADYDFVSIDYLADDLQAHARAAENTDPEILYDIFMIQDDVLYFSDTYGNSPESRPDTLDLGARYVRQ
ncbi:MAG: hypothetical protein V3U76_01355 [Granulosicoccus sp.]